MLVIPAIDIYENSIVRLKKGDFGSITYYKNTPLQQAKLYDSLGFQSVHIVDLIGSKTGKLTSLDSIEKIKAATNLKIEFGGGIRDEKTVSELFTAGVDFVIIGSLSIKNRSEFELILRNYPAEKIIAAIDAKNEKVKITGWIEDTSISIYSHIEYCSKLGVKKFLCTDISKDGMLTGTNIELYKKIIEKYKDVQLIASGGVKDIEDLKSLKKINPYAVVVGKAIYEEKINLKELAKFAL
ncbi:MAG: 1-(5-phosphoribosyl)-5-[(5-phosphoribosylamino)methylideneamino]imidazole-4-carboxamide isomerase [Ignavibacteriaceae bacterium]|jgi:phosphoribosylformimino-5-aminoimidazole carboxamide ribotide isomerase